jgi:hypothetical protein
VICKALLGVDAVTHDLVEGGDSNVQPQNLAGSLRSQWKCTRLYLFVCVFQKLERVCPLHNTVSPFPL